MLHIDKADGDNQESRFKYYEEDEHDDDNEEEEDNDDLLEYLFKRHREYDS